MTEFFNNNPIALRHCLLFEVLQGISIENAFSKFRTTLGEDFMEYKEFEFWYQRLSDGNYDMNFERGRDEDKKIHKLSDMPLDVMEKIVGHLDIFDRSALARTSRSLKKFVKNQKLFHDNLTFETDLHSSKMKIGEKTKIVYTRDDDVKYFVASEQSIGGASHSDQAILDLKNILKQPNLHLDSFCINCEMGDDDLYNDPSDIKEIMDSTIDELEAALKSTQQLNVKKLIFESNYLDPLEQILPYFKPGYLTTIDVNISQEYHNLLDELVEMEQWKQAKYFTMVDILFYPPLHHLYHFKEFDVSCPNFAVEDVREMKKILFKSPDFKRCSIKVGVDIDVIGKKFGDAVPGLRNTYHYPIPNSTDYFNIYLSSWKIRITRKEI